MLNAALDLFVLVGLASALLHYSIEPTKIENLRNMLVQRWINVQYLSIPEQAKLALQNSYQRNIRHKSLFVIAFAFASIAILVTSALAITFLDTRELSGAVNKALRFDVDVSISVALEQRANDYSKCGSDGCKGEFEKSFRRDNFAHAFLLRDSVALFIDQTSASPARLKAIMITALLISWSVIFSILLLCLIASITLTLKVIASITNSSLPVGLVVVADAAVACLGPFILTNATFAVLSHARVFSGDGAISFPSLLDFHTVSFWSAAVGIAAYDLQEFFFAHEHAMLYLRLHNEDTRQLLEHYLAMSSTFLIWSWAIIKNFWYDVTHMKERFWQIDYRTALLNWSIGLDHAFSALYMAPAIFFAAAGRYAKFRDVICNWLQAIADHQRGPLIGISLIAAALAGAIRALLL